MNKPCTCIDSGSNVQPSAQKCTCGARTNGHIYHEREDDLAHCKLCNGGEGSLPTECPGEPMGAARADMVYRGELDYRNGKWWGAVRRMSVGDTAFEEWLSTMGVPKADPPLFTYYSKQQMRDAYSAGHEEGLCTWPREWDEARERAAFEHVAYQHYLARRGVDNVQYGVFDTPKVRPKAELFERSTSGDYVAYVYQAAWGGWKLARSAA